MADFGPTVSTEWLAKHLGDENLKIIDGSWRMPGDAPAREGAQNLKPALSDYERRHIPGAVFFDIDAIADQSTALPHMLPTAEAFAEAVSAMGIGNDDVLVVYDDQGLFSAARVWWTFRAMGHEKIAVLDGGLPKWLEEGRAVTDAATKPQAQKFRAQFQPDWVRNARDIRDALRSPNISVVDARPEARFKGAAPEPRPGLRSGHMPGAYSLPHGRLLTERGAMQSADEIKSAFAAAGVDLANDIVTTCGSGVTAAILSLALETIGHRAHALYDGSWAEWGAEWESESGAEGKDEERPVIAD